MPEFRRKPAPGAMRKPAPGAMRKPTPRNRSFSIRRRPVPQTKTSDRSSTSHAKPPLAVRKGRDTTATASQQKMAIGKSRDTAPTRRGIAKIEQIDSVSAFKHQMDRKVSMLPQPSKGLTVTMKQRYTDDPVDVYSHDGKAVFRFQPALYVR